MKLNVYPTKETLEDPSMVIIDIRTESEWIQTGIVKGSKCITFFKTDGTYDEEEFLKEIDALGGKEQHFGLICRTGSRTHQVAMYLYQKGYKVQNMAGGILKLIAEGYEPLKYEIDE